MELEVYNEYAIVQHYSDLTDYISENIYILDKKNQSKIITENWGLIALGGLIVIGLGILIWWLCTRNKDSKNKEKKEAKQTQTTQQVIQATEQAVERSEHSENELNSIDSFMAVAILKETIKFDDVKEVPDLLRTGKESFSLVNHNTIDVFDLVKVSISNDITFENVKDALKKYTDIANIAKKGSGIVKTLSTLIKIESIKEYLDKVKNKEVSQEIKLSPNAQKAIAKVIATNRNIDQLYKDANQAYDNAELAGSHDDTLISLNDTLNMKDKDVQSSFLKLSGFQGLSNNNKKPFDIDTEPLDDASIKILNYFKSLKQDNPKKVSFRTAEYGTMTKEEFKVYKETSEKILELLNLNILSTTMNDIYDVVYFAANSDFKYLLKSNKGNPDPDLKDLDSNDNRAIAFIRAKIMEIALVASINNIRLYYKGQKIKKNLSEMKCNQENSGSIISVKFQNSSAQTYDTPKAAQEDLEKNFTKEDQIDKPVINKLLKTLINELKVFYNTHQYIDEFNKQITALCVTVFAGASSHVDQLANLKANTSVQTSIT